MASAAVGRRLVFGLAVTVHTPSHAERGHLLNLIHARYVAVASIAAYAALNVALVVEVNVIGQHVHVNPLHGLVVIVALGELLDPWRIRFNNAVAIHAHGSGGNVRVRALIHIGVAIEALNFPLARMKRVAKWNWLGRSVSNPAAGKKEQTEGHDGSHGENEARENELFLSLMLGGVAMISHSLFLCKLGSVCRITITMKCRFSYSFFTLTS
jgi:hypothetical protein